MLVLGPNNKLALQGELDVRCLNLTEDTLKGVIIEGVVAAGKSSLLSAVVSSLHGMYPNISKIHLSEHYTERALHRSRQEGKLTGAVVRVHMDRITEMMTDYHQMYLDSPFARPGCKPTLLVTLERFALTHLATMPDDRQYSVSHAREHLRRLGAMGFRQVILHVPARILGSRILFTLEHRNEAWRNFLFSRGTLADIISFYAAWQERMMDFAGDCDDVIDTIVYEVEEGRGDEYAQSVVEFLIGSSGGKPSRK